MKLREEQRRAQILRAVAEVMAEEGIDGATVRKIARRANVSTGMLMHYFENKREMVTETLAAASRHFEERTDAMVGRVSDIRRIETWLRIVLPERDEETPPWSFWLEFWAHAARDEELRSYQEARFALGRDSLVRHIEAGKKQGRMAADLDSAAVAELLQAFSYGLGVTVSTAPGQISPEHAMELSYLLLSLLARPKPAQSSSNGSTPLAD
jgi:TetR/AcrR family transcriptional regulator, transcriptional repressor of bet genes